MAKILVDVNVILDAILNRDDISKEVLDKLAESQNELFITASMVATLDYFLTKYEANKKEFKKEFFNKFKVITTSGRNALNALDFEDGEDALIALAFKRIAEDGIIITHDKKFPSNGLLVLTPEEALNNHKLFSQQNNEPIPLLDLQKEYRYVMEEIDERILECIAESKYILGPEVSELEQKVANYIGTKHAIGVSSGTDALVISLRALAIKNKGQEYWNKEDLIITTPFTFTATGDAILRAGATPLFVDIDPATFNIDPEQIKKAILKYREKVTGILPVHLYGQPVNMDEIIKIAKENNLFVVEDCAQSFGAKWDGKQTGSFGDTGCFSFFPSKNLGGFGDGGMITTDDDELAEIIRILRKHGGKDKYNVDHIGYNARLDTLQAAILLAKISHIDDFNNRRRKIASFYDEHLKEIAWVKMSEVHKKAYHVYHQYTINLLNKKRDEIQRRLKEKGIQTMVYYPVTLHKMKVFKNRCECVGEPRNAIEATQQVLSLPIEPMNGKEICRKVVEGVRSLG